MRRLARHSLYLALALSLVWPHVALAAPGDGGDLGLWSRVGAWLSKVWGPVIGNFDGCGDSDGGPTSDPDGFVDSACAGSTQPPATTQSAPTGGGSEQDGGPTSDPNG